MSNLISPNDKHPKTFEEWARHFWRMARHMFERDGYHIHIAFLLHDGNLLQIREMQTESKGELFVTYRELANEVARAGATEVIVIGEIWTAPFDPAHPYRRAEFSPERGEALQLSAVSADGKQMSLFAAVTRRKGRAELGETVEDRKVVQHSLAPVVSVWRAPPPEPPEPAGAAR